MEGQKRDFEVFGVRETVGTQLGDPGSVFSWTAGVTLKAKQMPSCILGFIPNSPVTCLGSLGEELSLIKCQIYSTTYIFSKHLLTCLLS